MKRMKAKELLIFSCLIFLIGTLYAQEVPGQYREEFAESVSIREQQHL